MSPVTSTVTRVDLARWVDAAACADRPHLPWVQDAHLVTGTDRAQMAAVCAGCPVLARCQDAAVQLEATAGYWAGTPRDAEVLEPAQVEPVQAPVEWVPYRVTRAGWEQAALVWPAAGAGAGAGAVAGVAGDAA